MRPHSSTPFWTRIRRGALAVDAWFDASLYGAWRSLANGWRVYTEALDRLRVRGLRRVAAELAGEGLTLGTAGGVVVLALAIPAFQETKGDNWLKRQDLAVTFLDRYGNEIGRRGIRRDDSVRLAQFPEHLIKAVLATEDRRFFDHWGVDPIGTLRALTVNARSSGVVQGGSTLTQQLAKNLFLSNERSIERKIKEAFLAAWLEFHLTKPEILQLYLDRAYMGGGTFGVGAAAEYYFGKSVKDVSLSEAAMLAGLFKAPTKYAPHVNLPAARARANDVLANMVEAGFLTEGEVQAARRKPATPVDRQRETTPDYYLDWAFQQVQRLSDAGKLGADSVVTVKTPLDVGLQNRVQRTLDDLLRQDGKRYDVDQAAMVVMEPDGAVRAIVGGRDYGKSQFNRATAGERQPGSSFKPFVYAAALTYDNYHPDKNVVDSPVCLGNWCPSNYGHSFSGAQPLWLALAKSVNTIPVKMSITIGRALGEKHEFRAAKLGRQKIVELAHAMGLTTALNDTVSLPIGAAEVTVLDMTAGYSVFANGGYRADPYAAIEIRNSQGKVIYRRDRDEPRPVEVLSPRVVSEMNFMLRKVNDQGTGRSAALQGIPSAGKTGTTNAYKDAWYVGFTGNFVSAVWFGNDDSTSTANMTGGSLPARAWHEVMTYAHQNVELKPIPGTTASGQMVANASAPGGASAANGAVAQAKAEDGRMLSGRSAEVIGSLGQAFRAAEDPALPARLEKSGASPALEAEARIRPSALGGRVVTP